MGSIVQFLQSEGGAAILRGLILGGIVLILLGVFFLDRYVRRRLMLIQGSLDLILTRVGPDERSRDFAGIVRKVLVDLEQERDQKRFLPPDQE